MFLLVESSSLLPSLTWEGHYVRERGVFSTMDLNFDLGFDYLLNLICWTWWGSTLRTSFSSMLEWTLRISLCFWTVTLTWDFLSQTVSFSRGSVLICYFGLLFSVPRFFNLLVCTVSSSQVLKGCHCFSLFVIIFVLVSFMGPMLFSEVFSCRENQTV